METYHKINALFKRHMSGPKKGKLIMNDWAQPEFEYLAKNEWEFTEKVDGTNIRVHFHRFDGSFVVDFGGRSDNAVIPKPLLWALEGMFGDATAAARIEPWMEENELTCVTLYGEGYGPKIQSGGNYRSNVSFVLFDVKIGDFWLDRENVNDVAEKLGIDSVPVLGRGTIYDAIDIVTIGLGPDANGRTTSFGSASVKHGLASRWGDFEAEGIVARPVVPLFNRKGERVITKVKTVDFK
jgi:hypothetical protein